MRSLLTLAAVLSALAPTDGRVLDLAGRPADPLARAGAATVLVFTRTDCPISNRYAPELRRLHDRFAPRGAVFWLVYADPSETVDAIEAHRRSFGLGFDALRDPDHALVRLTGATVTPEVAVFAARAGGADGAGGEAGGGAGPRMVYRGRIDDRAVDFGRTRVEPTRHDLAEVLETILSGGTVAPRTTTAVGCYIAARP
jgi:AhpC/TSA family protein